MRDSKNNRGGFDRVLMAVAATFLTVSATSAMAQGANRASPAELAIDAAVPRPEPANLPPPTASDFKMDTTASTAPAAEAKPSDVKSSDVKPIDVAAPAPAVPSTTMPIATMAPSVPLPSTPLTASTDSAAPAPAAAPAAAPAIAAAPPAEPPVKVSTVPAADQPVADKLKDMLAAKSLRYFDRKTERAAVDKFYGARDYAPLWTQSGSLTENGRGVIARLKDAGSDGLNPADYAVPDFAAATSPDTLAEADLKLTASMLDYARQAQSGRMHWSQVSADIQYPDHP